ncbi:ATP-dependent helicase/deoxyribonuclease subunit [Trichinella pseudospiralis]
MMTCVAYVECEKCWKDKCAVGSDNYNTLLDANGKQRQIERDGQIDLDRTRNISPNPACQMRKRQQQQQQQQQQQHIDNNISRKRVTNVKLGESRHKKQHLID